MSRSSSPVVPDLAGKVAIITGAHSGLGWETTCVLAGKGCTVYFAGRNPAVLEAAIARMRASQPGLADAKLRALVLDLSSIASVVAAARSFSEPRLDIVVANAAVALDNGTALSEDGWERHFQVNHLGHFALVTTLLPLLQATARAHGDVRIVCVSSIAHRLVREIDFDALTREVHSDLLGPVGSLKRYGQSKLSNILFAQELDRRLHDHGVTNVWVNSCHPGIITSTRLGGMGNQFGTPALYGWLMRRVVGVFAFTEQEGASTQVHLAASPEVVDKAIHGQYLVPTRGWLGGWTGCAEERRRKHARDEAIARELWTLSEKAVEAVCGRPQ